MRDTGIPNGLTAIGYTERDIPALIEGTLRQPRLLAGAPRTVGAAELEWILRDAMQYW
jgi:hydroxyacid-oxoacid transhydrogenase